jgi:hypothetical protein
MITQLDKFSLYILYVYVNIYFNICRYIIIIKSNFNLVRPCGNYVLILICNAVFCMVLSVNSDYFVKQLIVVMVEYSVLFEVRTGFLNFI